MSKIIEEAQAASELVEVSWKKRIDNENRISIPAAIWRELGLAPGEQCLVDFRDGRLTISKPDASTPAN